MTQHARICSRHFHDDDFIIVKGKRKLKKDAIPSLFLTESEENNYRLMSLIESPEDRMPLRNVSNVTPSVTPNIQPAKCFHVAQVENNKGSENRSGRWDSSVNVIRKRLQRDLLAGSVDPVMFNASGTIMNEEDRMRQHLAAGMLENDHKQGATEPHLDKHGANSLAGSKIGIDLQDHVPLQAKRFVLIWFK